MAPLRPWKAAMDDPEVCVTWTGAMRPSSVIAAWRPALWSALIRTSAPGWSGPVSVPHTKMLCGFTEGLGIRSRGRVRKAGNIPVAIAAAMASSADMPPSFSAV